MGLLRHLKNVSTLDFHSAKCVACGRCAEVCPHEVFAVDDGKVLVADADACMECGACATNCPAGAISVDSGVGCALGMLEEYWQELKNRRGRGATP